MPGKIQLLLPGLFDLPLSELSPGLLNDGLPVLNRVLRLSTPRPGFGFTIDAMLREALALGSSADEPHTGLPLAQAYAPREQRQSNRRLLFSAVHLRPDLHSAVVVPIPNSDKNIDDISIIINDLKDLFDVDCDIDAVDDGLFLMALKRFDAPTHYAHILSVLGKPANPYIEQSRDHLDWYKLLNEMQMYLHQHELNQDRERRGQLPINSLWFWGGGGLPGNVDSSTAWYCDDTVLNRFAESLDLAPASLSELADLDRSFAATVVDLRLLEYMKTGLAIELDRLLRDIETRLLQPVMEAVERDRKTLYLRAGYESDLQLTPASLLKFWRRPRNLASWTQPSSDA